MMLVRFCHCSSRPSKMPTSFHSQALPPSRFCQMKEFSGMVSPTFHPYLSASRR
jgi:hypothetical protein